MKIRKIVSVALVAALVGMGSTSFASSDVDFSYLLKKIGETENQEKKELGIELFKEYMEGDDPDVDGLKKAIRMVTDSETRKKLEDKGYDFDEIVSEMDVMKDMSSSDIGKVIVAMETNDFSEVEEIAEKYYEEDNGSSGSGGGSGGSTGETSKEDGKTEAAKPDEAVKEEKAYKFSDMEGHWARETVEKLASKGIVNGKSEGIFDPEGPVTRAEFASLVVRALDIKPAEGAASLAFSDVEQGSWYYESVAAAWSNGIISGYANGRFAPSDVVTREQMVKILIEAMKSKGMNEESEAAQDALAGAADAGSISDWAVDSMKRAVSMGIIKGDPNSNINPSAGATRAQSAVMISRILK